MSRYLTRLFARSFLTNNCVMVNRNYRIASKPRFVIFPENSFNLGRINRDFEEPKDFDKFIEDTKSGLSSAVNVLMTVLDISQANAKTTVNEYPIFVNVTKSMIITNFKILRAAGICKSTIKDNKFLLAQTTEELEKKIFYAEKIGIEINAATNLFHLSNKVLKRAYEISAIDATYLPANNRFQYLADKLKCDLPKICNVVCFCPYMLNITAPKIMSITEYILEFGMSPENILKDMTIYKYQISTIKYKLERAKAAGISNLKPWILRLTEDELLKYDIRNSNRIKLLCNNKSLQERLCQIFNCDEDIVNYLFFNNPSVPTMKMEKILKLATFLTDAGYTITDILRTPRIMGRRYETIKEYWDICQEHNVRLMLFTFLYDKEKFMKYVIKHQAKDKINTD